MKLFNTEQIRKWDSYTIQHEPIQSVLLMKRAAEESARWLIQNVSSEKNIICVCGTGNNGGDGLVIAQILKKNGFKVSIAVVQLEKASDDFQYYKNNLSNNIECFEISDHIKNWERINHFDIVIDAIFGTGINRPISNWIAGFISWLNSTKKYIISIDIPSGLPADFSSINNYQNGIIEADITLTFQTPKLSFLLPDTGKFVNQFVILNIGLHSGYEMETQTQFEFLLSQEIADIIQPRPKFDHKGQRGSSLMLCGSENMNGALILSCKANILTGSGITYAYIPKNEIRTIYNSVPEAIVLKDLKVASLKHISAIACGPGLGDSEHSVYSVLWSLDQNKKLVLDADALNIISKNNLINRIPPNTIITPHLKEFDRLFNIAPLSSIDRLNYAIQAAIQYKLIIILKGAHTAIINIDGKVYFNSTGNYLLSTAGSGDVLTGIITALLSQGYSELHAAKIGVFLHGYTANILKNEYEFVSASMIAEMIPKALKSLTNKISY